jgi:hypothetical protein
MSLSSDLASTTSINTSTHAIPECLREHRGWTSTAFLMRRMAGLMTSKRLLSASGNTSSRIHLDWPVIGNDR